MVADFPALHQDQDRPAERQRKQQRAPEHAARQGEEGLQRGQRAQRAGGVPHLAEPLQDTEGEYWTC